MTALYLLLAGGLGACLRFVIDRVVERRVGRRTTSGIVLVNLLGSFILGLVTGWMHASAVAGAPYIHYIPAATMQMQLILSVGFCGGFTTWSTAMVDTVRLGRTGKPGLAAFHLLATFSGAVLLLQLGYVFTA